MEDILVVEEFKRTQFPILMCLFGFSSCGKTYSAIKIARGMGGKTMFLDTETGRGRVYAKDAVSCDGTPFSYSEMTPPFTPERYIAAIKQIENMGFDNLIIDSGSHEWDGLGGMLEIADENVDSHGRMKKGLGKWSVKSRHKSFMHVLLSSKLNIIICLRAKDKYVQKKNEKGMEEIIKDGFVALQERNFIYDMMIQLPMPVEGEGRYSMDKKLGFKCPGDLLPAFTGEQINEELGRKIGSWVHVGEAVDQVMKQLKDDAEQEAQKGVGSFREWWKTLPREQKEKLHPQLKNLQSIAESSDYELGIIQNKHGDDSLNVGMDVAPVTGDDLVKA